MDDETGGDDRQLTDGGVPTRVPDGVPGDAGPELLDARRRRETLRVLSNRRSVAWLDGERSTLVVELDGLVEGVAERERRTPGHRVESPRQHRSTVERALRRDHLPALEEAGVLEYDETAETVTYSGDPEVDAGLSVEE